MRSIGELRVNALLVLGASLITCAVLFAAGETLLRARYGALLASVPEGVRAYDELRGWKLRPGRYAYFDVRAVRRVDVAVNELGLRNPPLAAAPAPGVERITLLGDSFVYGAPLGEADTIAGRLRALAGEGFEIVNAGVPGYGTGQQYRLIEELQANGTRLGRKLVLFFFTNDIQDNLGLHYPTLERNPRQPAFGFDAEGGLHQSASRPPIARRKARECCWHDGLMSLHVLRYQLEVLAVSHPRIVRALDTLGLAPDLPRTPGVVAGWYGPGWWDRWRLTEALLEHVITTLRRAPDAPEVFVAFVPSPFQVQDFFRRTLAAGAEEDERYAGFLADPDRPQRLLQSVARRLGAPFIDLTPALRAAAGHAPVYFPREGHFNEAGAEIAARVVYAWLIDPYAAWSRAGAIPAATAVTSSR